MRTIFVCGDHSKQVTARSEATKCAPSLSATVHLICTPRHLTQVRGNPRELHTVPPGCIAMYAPPNGPPIGYAGQRPVLIPHSSLIHSYELHAATDPQPRRTQMRHRIVPLRYEMCDPNIKQVLGYFTGVFSCASQDIQG